MLLLSKKYPEIQLLQYVSLLQYRQLSGHLSQTPFFEKYPSTQERHLHDFFSVLLHFVSHGIQFPSDKNAEWLQLVQLSLLSKQLLQDEAHSLHFFSFT